MYLNTGYLNHSLIDFKDKSHPLIVGSSGNYRLSSHHKMPTYRPRGRLDYQIIYISSGLGHFHFGTVENETIVSRGNLIRGKTKTCGKCKHIPLGELKIKEILENNKIKYFQQYSFPDLKGKRNFLKFDFAIFKDEKIEYLIEF